MKKWRLLPWLVLYILLSAMPPAKPSSCPTCEHGYALSNCQCVKCGAEQYWSLRNGEATCNTCTEHCEDTNHMTEVTTCTSTADRSCKCKPGYYCPSPVKQTCRRSCLPCTGGFTNTSNLNRNCQKYTDCASLGKVVIKKGSPTSDHVCGSPPKHTTLNPTTLDTRISSLLPDITEFRVNQSNVTDLQTGHQNSGKSLSSETTDSSWTPGVKEGPVPQSETLSKTTWVFLLLLVITLLCLVSCLFLKCKSRAIKNKLEWAGLVYGRYHMFPTASPNLNVETSVAVSDVTDPVREHVQGQGSFPGKNQKVTMEHVGKADGINNTVGSIFIYSPGMVILGSNSNEKKEEVETSGEDSSEATCLFSVPQQESSSEEDFVRFATQEELGKELSIPIPATSK